MALAFVASRAPFIDNGYGTKPDAWRIALSGYWLWDHHEFYPSRLPGYPVPELSYALVVKGGWVATNSLTIAVSLLGLWFFANIVRELKMPNRRPARGRVRVPAAALDQQHEHDGLRVGADVHPRRLLLPDHGTDRLRRA